MNLLVVIVNYRTPQLTIDCLRSLEPEVRAVPETRAIIVDNASQDDSVKQITSAIKQHGWDAWASIMPLTNNGGFAAGNNAAIAPALKSSDPPRYVYLLNPDTIVLPGALCELVKFMDAHDAVGIAGGRSEARGGSVHNSSFRFHTVMSELEGGLRLSIASKLLRRWIVAPGVSPEAGPTDWVAGASMIVRREVFETIGLLDERYFMYYEETDFCLRARRAGWPTWYVPGSRIIHFIGESSGISGLNRVEKRRPKYWFDSRHLFFRSNYGIARTMLADLAWTAGYAAHSVLRVLRGKPRTEPPWLLWDFVRYNTTIWTHRA